MFPKSVEIIANYVGMITCSDPPPRNSRKSIELKRYRKALIIINNILCAPQYKTKQHHKLQINLESAV